MNIAAPPVYFLLQIPRTSEQTIERHLARHAARGTFWMPRHSARKPPGPNVNPAKIRAVSGHFLSAGHERLFPDREIRRAVLLQDPLELQVSYYNYRMMNHLTRGWGTYDFSLHHRSLPRNSMAHWLLSDWHGLSSAALMTMSDSRKYDLVNQTLSDFWFVGRHSDGDRLIGALAKDLDVPARARPHNTSREWLRQVDWELFRQEDIPEAESAAFRRRHALDQAIWESWRDAFSDARAVKPAPYAGGGSALTDAPLRFAFEAKRLFLRRRFGKRATAAGANGDAAGRAGNWTDAVRHYRAALDRMPEAPALWMRYGRALAKLGFKDAAEHAYREAVALEPRRLKTQRELVKLLVSRGHGKGQAWAEARNAGGKPRRRWKWRAAGTAAAER